MRPLLLLFVFASIISCKPTQEAAISSGSKPAGKKVQQPGSLKEIIVDSDRLFASEVDFSVLKWTATRDTLEVIVRYSGGCKPHEFNAYFSGSWLKTLPAQAIVDIEHLNLENDECRSLVKDTLKFDLKNLQYPEGKDVVVKWSVNPEMNTTYRYWKTK